MILLHGSFASGQFFLWGETPPLKASSRTATASRASTLPFAAKRAQLVAALDAVLPSDSGKNDAVNAIMWLPTIDRQPVASSPLIAEPPESVQGAELRPWRVPALQLTPDRVLDLLCACQGKTTLAPGVIAGKTLIYWAAILHVAGRLVAREQFLPHVEQRQGSWHACWKPVLGGTEPRRLAQLAEAMPAACRAVTLTAEAPAGQAITILGDVTGLLVDELVRSALGDQTPAVSTSRRKAVAATFDSLHDQWFHALRTHDTLTGNETELAALAEQVAGWQRPVMLASAVPFRLCFRLEEPKENGNGANGNDANGANGHEPTKNGAAHEQWTVRYLLQAQDDPSLLVPAAKAWKPTGPTAKLLQRGGFEPRTYLLSALGQAAGLAPPIEASLHSPAPADFPATSADAFQFLTESSLLLEQAGFGVILPAWWTRTGSKQRLTATAHVQTPKSKGDGGGLSLDAIVQFNWQIALGDQLLTMEELEALVRLKQPLVRVRGQWVQVNAAEIQAALDYWKNKEDTPATVREVIQMALGRAAPPGGLTFGGVRATGWLAELVDELEGRASFEELLPPAGLHGTLRPYQLRGYSWLAFLRRWGFGACLADDMGLGKTVQTLALVQHDWESSDDRRPTLLVCPTSVMGNWRKEAERFTPGLPVLIHHGVERTRGAAFAKTAAEQAVVICSYALLHRDLEHLQEVRWAAVILDEAQFIKNHLTKQAQAARSLPANLRVALTGTPVENHVGDLWSIGEFLNPGFLGSQAEFRRRFQIPIQAGRDPEAAERLKRLTGPFLLRRLKTDKSIIADLPDKLEMKVYCNLTKEQASLYAAVVAELDSELKKADGIKRKGVVLAALSKLKQVCDHPAQFLGDHSAIAERSGKLARLTEMLDEIAQVGERALIFSQFSEMGTILQKHLQETFGHEVPFLHGSVTPKQRDRLVARFQEADGPRFFLLSLKAGGTGLNLTAANHVFHFDRWWNPAVENQATDRAFRIGQQRNVQVHKFICVGTLEEKIDEMIERKKAVADKVVGTGENWLTELSNEQLRDLVALRQEALGD